jgi:hypothetical protein
MKNSIYAFYTLLILSTLSCGKTTKGKLDNEWKVVEYEMKEDQIYNIGDLYGTSVHMTETDYTTLSTTRIRRTGSNILNLPTAL